MAVWVLGDNLEKTGKRWAIPRMSVDGDEVR
jgi:hypothetical protein